MKLLLNIKRTLTWLFYYIVKEYKIDKIITIILNLKKKKITEQINTQKNQVQNKIDQAKKDSESQAKKSIEQEGKKAIDDLKKKLGF